MSDRLNIVYESSVDRLTEINSSFDKGVLRVAYTGKNRNKSFISRQDFESCIHTIYNCPIVCNYDRETNSIGAHDIELVVSDDGMKLVNVTQPVGVVPESANYWWEDIKDSSGEIHEYLCVDVILWKRQEAYDKIKGNRITSESMEITVKSGHEEDGYNHIDSFEFTAFCLLESAEPCFEGARLEMFSNIEEDCHDSYSKWRTMMTDYVSTGANKAYRDSKYYDKANTGAEPDTSKDYDNSTASHSEICARTILTSPEFDIKQPTVTSGEDNLSKGGDYTLDDKMKLLSEYGLTMVDIDFDMEPISMEELIAKFQSIKEAKEAEAFALAESFRSELIDALEEQKFKDEYWGEMIKYWYVDYDSDASEVYCYDGEDGKLYGFKYSMNGDNVVIDFDSKQRKKFVIADFDEGDAEPNYVFAVDGYVKAATKIKDAEIANVNSEWEKKYSESTETVATLEHELEELREYKKAKMDEERKAAEAEVFACFADLNGIEAFEQLREDCANMTIEEIENKCYEIRGRNASSLQAYSLNKSPKSTRITVEKQSDEEHEPYGGLFKKYPPQN